LGEKGGLEGGLWVYIATEGDQAAILGEIGLIDEPIAMGLGIG